ncbi:MAG: gamma-glutamylcyclotransferase family protein [Pseudomonadota bacterium]
MKFFYFAYGSNLLGERLKARCPSAELVGRAIANNHRFDFSKSSIDLSGKCNIRKRPGSVVAGAVYAIDEAEQPHLDRAEGTHRTTDPVRYERHHDFIVSLENGSTVNTRTYQAATPERFDPPYDWYLALVIAGAIQNNLSSQHIAGLRQTRFRRDREAPGFGAAVDALKAAGYNKWEHLLERD